MTELTQLILESLNNYFIENEMKYLQLQTQFEEYKFQTNQQIEGLNGEIKDLHEIIATLTSAIKDMKSQMLIYYKMIENLNGDLNVCIQQVKPQPIQPTQQNEVEVPVQMLNEQTIQQLEPKVIEPTEEVSNEKKQTENEISSEMKEKKEEVIEIKEIKQRNDIITQQMKEMIEKTTEQKIKECIYQGTVDGFTSQQFNEQCKATKKVVIVVKTKQEEIIGAYSSDIPTLSHEEGEEEENEEVGIFGDKEHFVFKIEKDSLVKFVKKEKLSYSTWIYPNESENMLGFAGAFVIASHCDKDDKSRISGNFARDYIHNGDSLLKNQQFTVDDIAVYQLE